MARHGRLVVPGRFQPPHLGHARLVEHALSLADEVILVIGSAQESHTLENPLTAGERFHLLRVLLDEEVDSWRGRVYIVPVMDIQMNAVWVQYLRMLLPPFEGVVSGNPLVRVLFEEMGYASYKPPMYRREACSGRRIRELILQGRSEWRSCLTRGLLGELERLGFEERLRRLAETDEAG